MKKLSSLLALIFCINIYALSPLSTRIRDRKLLRSEVTNAVSLIESIRNPSEVLSSSTVCPILSGITEKENDQKDIPPCSHSLAANSVGSPVNTSLIDLRRIVREASERCLNCSSSGGVPFDPGMVDELVRDRMDAIRRRNGNRDRTDWTTANVIPPKYMHTTVPGYPLNYKDPVLGEELKKVHDQIRKPIKDCDIREEARFISGILLVQADRSAGTRDYEEAKKLLEMAKNLADFATGVIPGISEARDAYEFFTGKDAFTGEALSPTSRTMAALGMIPFLGGALKGGKALGKLAAAASKYLPGVYKKVSSITERASKLAKKVEHWNPCSIRIIASNPCRPDQIPLKHIVKGDFDESGKLIEGLHFPNEMEAYIKTLPSEIANKVTIKDRGNGVKRYFLPKEAYANGARVPKFKTMFPKGWTPEMVTDAVNKVLKKRGYTDISNVTTAIPVDASIDGIPFPIRVVIGGGRVLTSHPL